MAIQAKDYLDSYPELLTYVSGDSEIETLGPRSPNSRETNRTVFIGSEKALNAAKESSPAVVICHTLAAEACKSNFPDAFIAKTDNVSLVMALSNNKFFPVTKHKSAFTKGQPIHPSAVIHPTAEMGEQVIIGPNAVVGENVKIGDFSFIGGNSHLEPNVTIGDHTHIYPNVYIGFDCQIGNRCEVQPQTTIGTAGYGYAHNNNNEYFSIPHYGKVIIEDDVQIGSNNAFDRGTYGDTIIGQGAKIDNHCHFPHNFKIGKNAVITAGFLAGGNTEIGDNFVCGGRTNVNGHIKICDNVQLGAVSTALKSITEPGPYAGYPLAKHRDAIKYMASLPSVPEMRKTLNKIKKKLNL